MATRGHGNGEGAALPRYTQVKCAAISVAKLGRVDRKEGDGEMATGRGHGEGGKGKEVGRGRQGGGKGWFVDAV